MSTKIIKIAYYTALTALVATLAFYIMYNVQWLVGDDAIIIRQTGWGHFISPKGTTIPSAGRFFPLAYFVYNILYCLGQTSVTAHFGLMAIIFVIMAIVTSFLAYKSIKSESANYWKYIALISIVSIIIQRTYSNFLDAYSTIWFDYLLLISWCLCCYFVHTKQSISAAIIGFVIVSYFCYCLETIFIFPLSYGVCGLLFGWKQSTKLEKSYLFSMIATALLYLVLYYFICYIHIENAYDGAHGENVSIIGNALHQLIAQKILCLGILVLLFRTYRIIIKHDKYEFWDTIMLTGFAFCCGCAILRLNWVLYYSTASIFILPAIAYYLNKYVGTKWTAIVLLALAIFMCRKIPNYISENQKARINTTKMMNSIESLYKDGQTFYWYEPIDNREWNNDLEMRAWKRESLQTQIAYQIQNEKFKLVVIQQYDSVPGVYFLPKQNDVLFPESNNSIQGKNTTVLIDDDESFQIKLVK